MENSDDLFVFDIVSILFPIDFPICLQVQIPVSIMYNDHHKCRSFLLVTPIYLSSNDVFFCAFFRNKGIFLKL